MTFDEAKQRIRKEYRKLGHSLSWRFLYSSEATYKPNVDLLVLGLNPAGREKGVPSPSCEKGNAYHHEHWSKHDTHNRLQTQILKLFKLLAEGKEQPEQLMDRTLSANFCPFRSPSWKDLPQKKESIEFSRELWRGILLSVSPKVIICIGQTVFWEIGEMNNPPQQIATGWGDKKILVSSLHHEAGNSKLIGLPHLSRYSIFARKTDQPFEKKLLKIVKNAHR